LGVELHNGPDEERYIEGQVVIGQVRDIGGVYDLPKDQSKV